MKNKLIDYYSNGYNEDVRIRATRARSIEFNMTVEILDKFISKSSKICDIGAGTGVYSKFYAAQGVSVTAIEIVPKHVNILNDFVTQNPNCKLIPQLGDARNLNNIKDNFFDMVLCFGPFYHLRNRKDRIKSLKECMRIVKKSGIIAIAYINRHCAVSTFLNYNINISSNILNNLDSENYSFKSTDKFLNISYFSDPVSTEKQVNDVGLKVVDHIGVDGPYALLEKQIERLSESEYKAFYNYHRMTCRDKCTLGYSRHGLIICKK